MRSSRIFLGTLKPVLSREGGDWEKGWQFGWWSRGTRSVFSVGNHSYHCNSIKKAALYPVTDCIAVVLALANERSLRNATATHCIYFVYPDARHQSSCGHTTTCRHRYLLFQRNGDPMYLLGTNQSRGGEGQCTANVLLIISMTFAHVQNPTIEWLW